MGRRRIHLLGLACLWFFIVPGFASGETIQGFPQNAGMAGLVMITVQGDSIPHTGLLLSPNLAVTGKRWFSYSTNPRSVTVSHGHGSGRTPVTQTATDVWLHPSLNVALVRVRTAFAGAPTFVPAQVVPGTNANLFCFGFSAGGDLKRSELRVQSTSGTDYVAVSRARTDMVLNDGAGIPCVTEQNGAPSNTVTGVAVSTNPQNTETAQLGAVAFRDWIPNMVYLSSVRGRVRML